MPLTTIFFYLLVSAAWATCGLWVMAFFWTRRELKELKPLPPAKSELLAREPPISILLPARDEENRILKDCVASILKQSYQNFKLITVNDRSTDKTGEILREFAASNTAMLVVEGAELPANWLGKPFVLQQAYALAEDDWILTTDADIVFAPDVLRTAVLHVKNHDCDALCLLPFDVCKSFWEQIFLPTFSWLRMLKMPPTRVNNPGRPESMGVGNFFLMRRSALDKIGGFKAIRAEVAEDLKLAELLKQSGARFRLDYAPDLLQTRMYRGFGEIWHGFTKNFFAASNFSVGRTIGSAVSIGLFGVLPVCLSVFCLVAWLAVGQIYFLLLFVPTILIYICQTIVFAALQRNWKKPIGYAVFAPLGLALFAAILINSAKRVVTGRGVVWKGRAIYQRDDEAKSSSQIWENK